MRSFGLCLLLVLFVRAQCQVGPAHRGRAGVVKLTSAEWRTVRNAFHSQDPDRIAALVDPSAGLQVRRANDENHAGKHVSRAEITAYFKRIRAKHLDPRAEGPLGFTTVLPAKMPKADSKGRYTFDTGHEEETWDDSYVRFVVRKGQIWLDEITGWAEGGRLP